MLGNTLVGRYKIIRELSHGGFGQTFIAEDLHLPGHPKCVIKQLKPMDTRPVVLEAARKLFDREAETLYKLGTHRQIPSLLAHFEEGSEFYLAQEFIEGLVLNDEILPGKALSESYAIQLLQDLLQILDFVHGQGVIHRDIKPTNLIRRFADNRLVLIDFGAVKEASLQRLDPQGHTSSTLAVGTYGYMPDEQANGRPKFASDIYAVGMLCIQALTGILPNLLPENFETGEVIWRDRAPSISPELASFLDKMVRSHFTLRYQSAAEALEALQKVPVPANIAVFTTILPPPPIAPNISPSQFVPPSPTPGLPTTAPVTQSTIPDPPSLTTSPNIVSTEVQAVQTLLLPQKPNSPALATTTQPTVFRLNRKLVLLLIAGLAIFGAIASYVFVQNESDKRLLASLAQVKTSKKAGNFSQCIEGAKSIPVSSRYGKDAQDLLSECQNAQTDTQAKTLLAQAQKLAKENKLEAAIATVNKISSNSSSYAEAQKLLAQWSESLLQIATKQFQEQGKLDKAIALTKAIPANTPNGKKAQELAAQWQAQANADEAAVKAADKALKEGKWKEAIASSNKVKTAFWKKQTEPIIQKANAALNPAPAPVAAPVAEPVQARQPEPTYVEPAPVYRAPAPVYREPEPAYVPPPPRYTPTEVDSLPAPSKGN